jgi:hypothetical protein
MRNKVFGVIGVLLGGAALVNWMISGSPVSVSSAYQTGRTVGLVFGVLLLVSGAYSLLKRA